MSPTPAARPTRTTATSRSSTSIPATSTTRPRGGVEFAIGGAAPGTDLDLFVYESDAAGNARRVRRRLGRRDRRGGRLDHRGDRLLPGDHGLLQRDGHRLRGPRGVLPAQPDSRGCRRPCGPAGHPGQRPEPGLQVPFRAAPRHRIRRTRTCSSAVRRCTTATATRWPSTSSRSALTRRSTAAAAGPTSDSSTPARRRRRRRRRGR